ncbi:hypothetical protein GIY23_16810 [Allosaccharopolyspora coralli]|uniref:Uncharacterized protein n=1 Tax=Allosaccharopolyspora coralli TaxID=2665642 RepID=A0A5Q3QCI9_9PSEU|nr:hypothetical protein [Allosaccharopolyspora coralli]QGK70954.1 hypothetical protein GIY23_16810 [Allosaccharopolyspora coralli]
MTTMGWVLRGCLLLGVAVVSGLIWFAVAPDTEPEAQAPTPSAADDGKYRFDQYLRVETATCGEFSTARIAQYFRTHSCEHLTRALYTTMLPSGEKVLTSVVTARMPDAATAAELNALTTRDGTGNIQDLMSSDLDMPDDFPNLNKDLGYHSEQQDRLVVIGESSYFSSPGREDARLTEVTKDALRLGWPQDGETGPR